ncbi:conserved Plasmodium protein, unknown function [Plasmodium knowlesi strain H]|uniref:J domain-containing protein n=3 Tax=Plasmodium knowlesi TaxID=5850 RepID=A0A5K1U8P3_PLAKH|nr:conserved Plasmodium protein, unknown function [Plasmodium knowlesi strain H]OTN65148.1 Uncharacterized protein PKNOH_S120158600 [Plasmodium knowlesi]CAA9988442.1 conserved Plasmodium protein, unknown function [Plasmodium knowlesi strain H]SBO19852.1 conserved Plasmodium protein, unknown function [Plasmodium knowlesi strain H]SBO20433.1 conserved Plasmodium protein, unknown function [Plasmodium knowlesi strain H]VVS77916.1 conserved Plasmodium protein, unknown function [Plasmodium knowlesi |eukprot:XP_002259423.1 hypothetical protein, conserved in Plasmodium species [Plasmodium knowlesi strain H]
MNSKKNHLNKVGRQTGNPNLGRKNNSYKGSTYGQTNGGKVFKFMSDLKYNGYGKKLDGTHSDKSSSTSRNGKGYGVSSKGKGKKVEHEMGEEEKDDEEDDEEDGEDSDEYEDDMEDEEEDEESEESEEDEEDNDDDDDDDDGDDDEEEDETNSSETSEFSVKKKRKEKKLHKNDNFYEGVETSSTKNKMNPKNYNSDYYDIYSNIYSYYDIFTEDKNEKKKYKYFKDVFSNFDHKYENKEYNYGVDLSKKLQEKHIPIIHSNRGGNHFDKPYTKEDRGNASPPISNIPAAEHINSNSAGGSAKLGSNINIAFLSNKIFRNGDGKNSRGRKENADNRDGNDNNNSTDVAATMSDLHNEFYAGSGSLKTKRSNLKKSEAHKDSVLKSNKKKFVPLKKKKKKKSTSEDISMNDRENLSSQFSTNHSTNPISAVSATGNASTNANPNVTEFKKNLGHPKNGAEDIYGKYDFSDLRRSANNEKVKKKFSHPVDDVASIAKKSKGRSNKKPDLFDNQENSEASSATIYAKYANPMKGRGKSHMDAESGTTHRKGRIDNVNNVSNASDTSNLSNPSNISLDSSCSIELDEPLEEGKVADVKKEGNLKFLKNPTKKRMNKLKKILEILEYSIYNEEKKGSKLESKLYDYVLLTKSLKQEIANLEELNNSNKSKMANYEKDITKLKEQNEEMKLTLSTFENELSSLINKFDKNFAKELIDTKTQNDVLKKEVEKLKMEIEKKNNEIKKMENWNDMSKKLNGDNIVMQGGEGVVPCSVNTSGMNSTGTTNGPLNNGKMANGVVSSPNVETTGGNRIAALGDKSEQGGVPGGNPLEKNLKEPITTVYEFPFYYGTSEDIEPSIVDDLILKMKTIRIVYEKNIERYDDDTKATIYGCYISNFILENKDICNHRKVLKHLQEHCLVESKMLNVHLSLRRERCDNVPIKELEKEVIRQLENPDSDKNKEKVALINSIMLTLLFKNMHLYNLYRLFVTCLKCDNFRWIRLMKKSLFLKFFDLCLIDSNVKGNMHLPNVKEAHLIQVPPEDALPDPQGNVPMENPHQVQYNIKHPMFYCSNETLKRLISSMFLNFAKDPINPQNCDNIYHYVLQKKNFDLLKLLKLSGKNYNYIFNKNGENKTPLDYLDNEDIRIDLISGYILDIAGKGADNYKNAKYEVAFELYSEALEKQIKLSESVRMGKSMNENIGKLYYNRARTLMHLNKWIDVIENCNNCLKYIPKYINAFDTQIHAYENLLEYENALTTYKNMCMKCNIKPDDKEEKLKSQINATSFQILNVNRNCSVAEIKQAFSNLSKKWHPDKLGINSSPDIKKRHNNHFKRLFKAKQLLLNDAERMKEKKKKETNYVYPQIIEDVNNHSQGNNRTSSHNRQKKAATTGDSVNAPSQQKDGNVTNNSRNTNHNASTPHKDGVGGNAEHPPVNTNAGTFNNSTKDTSTFSGEAKNNFYHTYKDDIDKFQEKLKNFNKGLNSESENNKNGNPFLNLFDGKLTNLNNEKVDENFYKKLKEEYEGLSDDEITNFKTKISNSINNLIQTELNLKREYQELCIKEKTNVIMNARLCILQEIQKALCVRLDKERKLKVLDSIIKGRNGEQSANQAKANEGVDATAEEIPREYERDVPRIGRSEGYAPDTQGEEEKDYLQKNSSKFANGGSQADEKWENSRRKSNADDNDDRFFEDAAFFRDAQNTKGDSGLASADRKKGNAEGSDEHGLEGDHFTDGSNDDSYGGGSGVQRANKRNGDQMEHPKNTQKEAAENKMHEDAAKEFFHDDDRGYFEDNEKNKNTPSGSSNGCGGGDNVDHRNRRKKKSAEFNDNNVQWEEGETQTGESKKKNEKNKMAAENNDNENFIFWDEKGNAHHEGKETSYNFEAADIFQGKNEGKTQVKNDSNNFFESVSANQSSQINQQFRHSNGLPGECSSMGEYEKSFTGDRLEEKNFFFSSKGNKGKNTLNNTVGSFYDGNAEQPNGNENDHFPQRVKEQMTKEEVDGGEDDVESNGAMTSSHAFAKSMCERGPFDFPHGGNYDYELESRAREGGVAGESRHAREVHTEGGDAPNVGSGISANANSHKVNFPNEEDAYNYHRERMKDIMGTANGTPGNVKKVSKNGSNSSYDNEQSDGEEDIQQGLGRMTKNGMPNNSVPNNLVPGSSFQYNNNFHVDSSIDKNSDDGILRNDTYGTTNQHHVHGVGIKHLPPKVADHKEQDNNINGEENDPIKYSNTLKKEEQFADMRFPGSNSYVRKGVDQNMFNLLNMDANLAGSNSSGNLNSIYAEKFMKKNLMYSNDAVDRERRRSSFKQQVGTKYASDGEEVAKGEKFYGLYNDNIVGHSSGGTNASGDHQVNNFDPPFFSQPAHLSHDPPSNGRKNGHRNSTTRRDSNNDEAFANLNSYKYDQEIETQHQTPIRMSQQGYKNAEGGIFHNNSNSDGHYTNERYEENYQQERGYNRYYAPDEEEDTPNGPNNDDDKNFFQTDINTNHSNTNNLYENDMNNPFPEEIDSKENSFPFDDNNFPNSSSNFYENHLSKSYNYENVKLRNSLMYMNENEEKNKNLKKIFSNDLTSISMDKEFNQNSKFSFNQKVEKNKVKNGKGKVPSEENNYVKLKMSSLDKVSPNVDASKARPFVLSSGLTMGATSTPAALPVEGSLPKKIFKKNVNADDKHKAVDQMKRGKGKATDSAVTIGSRQNK